MSLLWVPSEVGERLVSKEIEEERYAKTMSPYCIGIFSVFHLSLLVMLGKKEL